MMLSEPSITTIANNNSLQLIRMEYTAVIRTLGTAGEKYQTLLNSLVNQTIKPEAIIVYIAEGYPIPKETAGIEQYVYVKKGMVAQRALQYEEVKTEYILFLDDDVFLPPNAIATLYGQMTEQLADVISPDVFPNSERSTKQEIWLMFSGRMFVRRHDKHWGYKVMRNAGYSYNKFPKPIMLSQTNAGPCSLCRKVDFLNIHFEEESWLDEMPYALGEDQVMFYKMYLNGLKVLTSYNSGIIHLDAGTATRNKEKEQVLAYCDCRFKTIFWRKFIFKNANIVNKMLDMICFGYTMCINLLLAVIKRDWKILEKKYSGYKSGFEFKI